ncbi:hypothetical protein K457DRAFT_20740 [Linnemannia elongata AG-77]|uniref:Uncharacterized protein n=1 Tax=Linnemannia elongata AG-77 TaxID=1314771 RepID=A0A197JTV3_9FUNG|nr:hypothetical protein K457DRAFT_20740 [Linnemannia elongata AG-77]
MSREETHQAFTKGPNSRVVWIEAFYHEQTRQHVIYWNDILDNFGPVNNIMKGPAVVTRARDSHGNDIVPRCIKYYHEAVLDVLIGDVFSSDAERFSSTPSISRLGTPDIDSLGGSMSCHTRTATSASSRLTVDGAQPFHFALSQSRQRNFRDNSGDDRDDVPAPTQPPTPASAETRRMREMNRLEQLSQEQSSAPKALGPHGQRSDSAPAKNNVARRQRMTEAAGEPESAESISVSTGTEGPSHVSPSSPTNTSGPDSSKKVDDSYNTFMVTNSGAPTKPIQRQAATQGSGTVELSDNITWIGDLPIISTSMSRADRPTSSKQTPQVIQEIQSTVQMFEQSVVKEQNEQAYVTFPAASIARPMAVLSTMSSNITQLQQQIERTTDQQSAHQQQLLEQLIPMVAQQNELLRVQAASKEREERMLQEQAESKIKEERMLKMQQETIDRLLVNQQQVDSILVQNYELHEYLIPRLFIVLPDSFSDWDPRNFLMDRFRLFFLCECGDECGTGARNGASSNQIGSAAATSTMNIPVENRIHLAKHEGYELSRPIEFFELYGTYILGILRILKHSLLAATVTAPLTALVHEDIVQGFKSISESTIHAIDMSTNILETKLGDTNVVDNIAALEGADLRRLGTFLRNNNEDKILGNLYRITTERGHVKWVCLDHYRQKYRSTALKELSQMVEINGGTCDQQRGRVIIRLTSSTMEKKFYAILMSTKGVHELELTLDWNTTFEDLRAIKDVIQQSTISHLSLDLRRNAGPTSNFIYRYRRAEPIVQIMTSPQIHALKLRNTTGFLSQAKDLLKTTLHVRHFDLSEAVSTAEDFTKLEKLIRASPTLARLSVVVGDMDDSFDRIRPFVAKHKSLSTLDLRLQDDTAASVKFEDGLSDKIKTICLKVTEPKSIRLMKMPMVTVVEFLSKYSLSKSVDLVQSSIKEHKLLQEIKIVHLPDGGSEVLRDLQQAIHDYCSGRNADETSAQQGDLNGGIGSPESPTLRDRFIELESLQRQSVLSSAELIIATTEGVEVSGNAVEETTEMSGKTEPVGVNNHNITSAFSLPRQDGSIAMVRYKQEEGGSHTAVLDVGDFDISKVVQCSSVTKLTLFGERGAILFNQLIKAPTTAGFTKLKTLEFVCKPGEMWGFLQVGQLARSRCPALTTLNLWNTNDTAMETLGIPPSRTLVTYNLLLRTMDFGDYFVSREEMLSFRKLFHGTPLISGTTMSVSSGALSDPAFAMATRVGLEEPDMEELECMVQPQTSEERPVVQWVMSNTAHVAPVDFHANSVCSDETSSVHFRRLAVRTESEASMIMEEDDEDEELIQRRITTLNIRDLSTSEE